MAGGNTDAAAQQERKQEQQRLPATSSLVGAACAALGGVCGIAGLGAAAPALPPQPQSLPMATEAAPCELCASESLPSRITSLGAVSYSTAGDDGGGSGGLRGCRSDSQLPNTSRKRRSLFISAVDVVMCDAPLASAPSESSDAGDGIGMEDVPLCDLAPLHHIS